MHKEKSKDKLTEILVETCIDFFVQHNFTIEESIKCASILLNSASSDPDITEEYFVEILERNLYMFQRIRKVMKCDGNN